MAPGVLALGVGVVLAVAGFVPWVAARYRRRGRMSAGSAILAFSVLVYALALLAYTMLPLPAEPADMCVSGGKAPQTRLFGFLSNIERHGGYHGPASLLNNWAIAQVLLNVVLFIPLGMFVRHARRHRRAAGGLAGAAVAGFLVSLLVECTQVTGGWFVYPCAYRQFDVDDLLVNTFGALCGAFAAPLVAVVSSRRDDPGEVGQPVTAGRRLAGMLSDVLLVALAGGVLSAVVDTVAVAAGGDVRAGGSGTTSYLVALLPAFGQLACIGVTGRTAGEAVVRLRPARMPTAGRAVLRWTLGIGGWSILAQADSMVSLLAYPLAVVTVVSVWTTRGHRGLAYASAGLEVQDVRSAAA
ncbi:VanZ family protein [Actinoplanes xinjiangensis]|nr:VanZ family protein [Actinoplanes xinjiangensis]